MDDRQYMGKLGRDLRAAQARIAELEAAPKVVYVVHQPGYDDDLGLVIGVAATPEIASAIEALGVAYFTQEMEVITSTDDIVPVTVYEFAGYRHRNGLWSFHHKSDTVWKKLVKVGECDPACISAHTPGVSLGQRVVRVTGTDEARCNAAFREAALIVEAEYGHDKLRTQVEELDPIERF